MPNGDLVHLAENKISGTKNWTKLPLDIKDIVYYSPVTMKDWPDLVFIGNKESEFHLLNINQENQDS